MAPSVLIVAKNLAMMRGGGATRALRFAAGLAERGSRVSVLCARPLVGRVRHPIELRVPVHMVRSPYLRALSYVLPRGRGILPRADDAIFARRALSAIARGTRPDVILTFGAFPLAARIRTRLGVPVVVANAGGLPSGDVAWAVRTVDAIVADGYDLDAFPRAYGVRPIEIRKGVDLERFVPGTRRMERPIRLLTVGRLVPVKNLGLAIDALGRVRSAGVDAGLTIVGEGPLRGSLERTAKRHGVAGWVRFTGHVPFEDLGSLYRAADVFVLSSSFDNYPNAVLEAMASGLPVVSTAVGGVPDMLDDGVEGRLVPAGDAAELSKAIASLVGDPSRARRMGDRARARVAARHRWDEALDRLQAVCAAAAHGGPAEPELLGAAS